MLMRRLIDSQLLAWKTSSRRKPLLMRGARQVGKTYSIRRLGTEHFEDLAVVDLERNREWHSVFSRDLSPRGILTELEVLLGRKIIPGKTLLFCSEAHRQMIVF